MTSSIGRLKRRPEFLRVARAGRKWAAPGVVLQAWSRPAEIEYGDAAPGDIRFGLTASRKVGGAVVRNRARRRLRAAAVEILPESGRPGYDYVLIARVGTVKRPYRELLQDLRTAVGRVETRSAKPNQP